MNPVAELALGALADRGNPPLPHYQRHLQRSTALHPPPFGEGWYGERYRSLAVNPAWIAHSLVANAKKEGEGAVTLWSLAGAIADPAMAGQVRDHAVDEARHARLYLGMLHQVFEGWSDDVRQQLKQETPTLEGAPSPQPLRPDNVVYDEIIQMNIGEIRTMIHQKLLAPVLLAWSPSSSTERLRRVLDTLLEDEIRHVAYTAKLIDDYAANGNDDFVAVVMERRIADFNEYTLNEIGVNQQS